MGDDLIKSQRGRVESAGTSRRRAASAAAAEKRADSKGEGLWYLATVAFASLAAAVVLQLWRADLRVPFSYAWDAVSSLAGTKGMLENGWFFTNPHLGAPGVQVLWDYPGSEFFNLLALRVIGFFARDAALTVNIYFLLGFPLIALTAFWAARTLGVSRPSSLLVAVLYTVLPYHFLRGEQHLFLSAYALVPPAIVLAIWAMRSDDRLAVFRKTPPAENISWLRRLGQVLLCVVIGAAGVYYALFAAFLLGVAGIVASVRLRKPKALLPAAFLIGVIALTMAVNIAPTFVYKAQAGPNQSAVVRDRSEAQVYGLRIDGLVLPAQGHRIPVLSRLQKAYFAWLGDEASAPYKENASEALGMLGALGFLALLVVLILRSELISAKPKGPDGLLGDASILNGAMIIVATSAGLGAIFSYMVPLIRAYNRISVFVAFLALLAVAALIDRVWAPGSRKGWRLAVVLGLVVLALLDQTTPAFVPAYAVTARKWKADAEFVSQVEGSLPADSSVFQLPYVSFPESPFVNQMIDYDHFRPYLHSQTIHWSYGAVKGREVDLWQREVSSRKVPEMISQLRAAGFKGLWIDRFGYADGAKAIEKQLTASLKAKGMQSRSGRYIFFKL